MTGRMAQEERALQAEIMMRSRLHSIIVIPIPNGLYLQGHSPSERALAAKYVAKLKTDGLLVPGAPDLCVLWPGGGGLVELKAPETKTLLGKKPAGRLSPEQRAFAERCRDLGINHAVCRSSEEFYAALEVWGALG